jgi:response regulator RpfG family c-di-GMP phosphodiesterase
VTRQRRIREAQHQTLVALSRLTDQAGLTTPGHGTRVARLAVPVAREAGVDDADLPEVEAAALLHDVGQVGLSRPIPGGATVEISLRDQRRVAATGAAILARTAELSRLAPIVADVGVPQHWAVERGDVATASRVVRVVSAYDDLAGTGTRLDGAQGPISAVERILRATPYEYDPDVVDALIRHLVRTGALSGSDLARLRRLQPGGRSAAQDRAS